MIERGGELPVTRQAELLGLSRSSVYYVPRALPERDPVLMRRLDELHLAHPFLGSRKLAEQLQREGHDVGRRHVRTLMRRMGVETIFRKPRTSLPAREATVYPYLLGSLPIERPNQVWASDITYLPMAHGFLYLAAIIDVYRRKVLSWRLSNTLTADFCVEALTEALGTYGAPEMFNTDQGAQFTSDEWITTLKTAGVAIIMDGKGRWIDNVLIERLWRSVKYEEVYLHGEVSGFLCVRPVDDSSSRVCVLSLYRFIVLPQPQSAGEAGRSSSIFIAPARSARQTPARTALSRRAITAPAASTSSSLRAASARSA
jgi:putative transposase